MTVTYESRQDFYTGLAATASSTCYLRSCLPRTLANKCDASHERYLHQAMGWKASTVNDWDC